MMAEDKITMEEMEIAMMSAMGKIKEAHPEVKIIMGEGDSMITQMMNNYNYAMHHLEWLHYSLAKCTQVTKEHGMDSPEYKEWTKTLIEKHKAAGEFLKKIKNKEE